MKKQAIILILIITLGIILCSTVSAAGLTNSSQPKYHHDNNNTGQSQFLGSQTNASKWNYTTKGSIDSSPAIGPDGTIYVGSYGDTDVPGMYAINPNGTLKWAYVVGAHHIDSSPAIANDGTIYFGCDDDNLYALNSGGALKWKYTTGDEINSPPSIGSDGTIYVGCNDHHLYAIYANGTQKWNYAANGIIDSSPAIGSDGTVYFGCEDGYLYAINSIGGLKWKWGIGDPLLTSPAIGPDGTIYIIGNFGWLYAVYSNNGTLKWKFTESDGLPTYSSPAIGSDGTIYYGCSGNLYAVNPNGSGKWKFTGFDYDNDIDYSSAAIGSDGTIYIGTTGNNGKLYAINSNGTLKWKYTTGGNIESSPAIGSDGTIYFGSDEGILYAIGISPFATPKGSYYNKNTTISLYLNEPGTIYWKDTNGLNIWQTYHSPIIISSTDTIQFYATDSYGDRSNVYTETYIIDTKAPTVSANLNNGFYNTIKAVSLLMSEPGTIYYTTNGCIPTTASDKYTGHITIASTTTLKFIAVDLAGNPSPVYSQTYTIDKVPPKVTSTYPRNKTTGVSRTRAISVKFSEKILKGVNWSKIVVKNKYGHAVSISKSIKGNTLYIETSKRGSYSYYTVYIPAKAVKDYAGNNLGSGYTFRFKTGRY